MAPRRSAEADEWRDQSSTCARQLQGRRIKRKGRTERLGPENVLRRPSPHRARGEIVTFSVSRDNGIA